MAPSAVAEGLETVRGRIAEACTRNGRDPREVSLVAVSKRIDLDLVADAVAAGQVDLGENRIPDAVTRQAELADLLAARGLADVTLRWHFIGHLQRNKAGRAAGAFGLLHAIDGVKLARRLETLLADRGDAAPVQDVLVEVNVSGEAQKHGVAPDDAVATAVEIAPLKGLRMRGFMTMARFGAPEAELRATFAGLRRIAETARRETGLPLPELSMGMSADFEAAIAEGATLVRVGTSIFGRRT